MTADIADHALLGDLYSAALVDREGSISWLCLPRFDSGACFAALLGGDAAGIWRLAPVDGGACTSRRYRPGTLILETEWDTPSGRVRIVDTMPLRNEAAHVVRVVEGLSGHVVMHMELRVRFDYGRIVPGVVRRNGGWSAVAGPDAMWLRTPVDLIERDQATHADFNVRAGDRVPFVLAYQSSTASAPDPPDADRALAQTATYWRDWLGQCAYDGKWSEAVHRSLITLKALTYAPTGGIVAAATTSLPERIGGERNWDYRYCWLRDATMTLEALLGAGYRSEARAWREWLLRAVAGEAGDLQIMYAVDGTRRIPEYPADWLPGFAGSAPVRIGNAAAEQFQLDVWGEVLDGLHVARTSGLALEEDVWELQQGLLDHLESNWTRPDHSLWEMRGPQRHFVHSKVMAWVGLDRGAAAAERLGQPEDAARWQTARDRIHAEVCERGYDGDRNTFTQFYGSQALDAALLLLPRVGFLPWNDSRVLGTIEAVRRELDLGGLLLRYRAGESARDEVDGLNGAEGAFVVCSFWLVDALQGTGRPDQARALFERLLELRNDVGLLSEEFDPIAGRQLGNIPQAFSHVGLVNSAHRLDF